MSTDQTPKDTFSQGVLPGFEIAMKHPEAIIKEKDTALEEVARLAAAESERLAPQYAWHGSVTPKGHIRLKATIRK